MKQSTAIVVSVWAIGLTVMGTQFINVSVKRPDPITVHDTTVVNITHHDTVHVISKAADTVRIVIKDVGPLAEQDIARLICGRLGLTFGDKRDVFYTNQLGMLVCPNNKLR